MTVRSLLDQAAPERKHDRMGPVGGAELGDERLDTLLHRVVGEDHHPGDLLVRVALGEVAQQLPLARAQRIGHAPGGACRLSRRAKSVRCRARALDPGHLGASTRIAGAPLERRVVVAVPGWRIHQVVGSVSRPQQRFEGRRIHRRQAGGGSVQRGDDRLGRGIARDVSARPCPQDRASLIGVARVSDHDDLGARLLPDPPHRVGRGRIGGGPDKDDLTAQAGKSRDGLSRRRTRQHGHQPGALEDGLEPEPRGRLRLDDRDPQCRSRSGCRVLRSLAP